MARVKYIDLLGDYRGKVCTPKYKDEAIFISRQKCYGKDKHGRPITGPRECYAIHRHEGKWPEGAAANRAQFGSVLKRAHAEVRDPERKAYWEQQLEEYRANKKVNEKDYKRLFAFVAAKLAMIPLLPTREADP